MSTMYVPIMSIITFEIISNFLHYQFNPHIVNCDALPSHKIISRHVAPGEEVLQFVIWEAAELTECQMITAHC